MPNLEHIQTDELEQHVKNHEKYKVCTPIVTWKDFRKVSDLYDRVHQGVYVRVHPYRHDTEYPDLLELYIAPMLARVSWALLTGLISSDQFDTMHKMWRKTH